MASGGAFGGSRGLKPIPPEKGVFPLDHFQECRPVMREYMECLKENKYNADRCRSLSKKYLECRMERNLMNKQDLKELGFREEDLNAPRIALAVVEEEEEESKLKQGFVSGIPRKSAK